MLNATIIKNGLVYNGSGEPPLAADVVIRGNRIAQVCRRKERRGDTVVDASGALVMPGFIDTAPHYDPCGILTSPYGEAFLKEGITTKIDGAAGVSLAPLFSGSLAYLAEEMDFRGITMNWTSLRELLTALERRGTGLNFGTLVGERTLLSGFTQGASRDLSQRESQSLREALSRSFREGAFGFSHDGGNANALALSGRNMRELACLTAHHGRVFAVSSLHADVDASEDVTRAIALARETEGTVIAHFAPLSEREGALAALSAIEEQAAGSAIRCIGSPFESIPVPVCSFLPKTIRQGSHAEMRAYLAMHEKDEFLLVHLTQFDPQSITIAKMPVPFRSFEGMSLARFASEGGWTGPQAFIKLMQLSGLKATCCYENALSQALGRFLVSPASLTTPHRACAPQACIAPEGCVLAPSRFLSLVEKYGIPLERAVEKVTSLPARLYRIEHRGRLREHYYADLVVFRNGTPSEVLVNGVFAVQSGIPQRTLSGKVLRCKS